MKCNSALVERIAAAVQDLCPTPADEHAGDHCPYQEAADTVRRIGHQDNHAEDATRTPWRLACLVVGCRWMPARRPDPYPSAANPWYLRCGRCGQARTVSAAPATSGSPRPWRVGRKVGRTIYSHPGGSEDGHLIGVMDSAADAALVVQAVNAAD